MTYCHISAQIAAHAAEQGDLTAGEIALERHIEELLGTPCNELPEPLRTEIDALIREKAWSIG